MRQCVKELKIAYIENRKYGYDRSGKAVHVGTDKAICGSLEFHDQQDHRSKQDREQMYLRIFIAFSEDYPEQKLYRTGNQY